MTQVERNDFYTRINRLIDWDYDTTKDSKYNTSRIPLQETAVVGKQWISSQDERIQQMSMSTIVPSTSMSNSIVGSNQIYERSFNNYQYNDVMTAWAGSISEGIIVPPPKKTNWKRLFERN